jgi:hypothetical protein
MISMSIGFHLRGLELSHDCGAYSEVNIVLFRCI